MGKGIVLYFHNEENEVLFESIILALKSRYRLVSAAQLEELLQQQKDLKNVCHITFDDGERSFYNIIFPILKKHQVPVSLFISPEIINSNKNFWFQEIRGYEPTIMKDIIAAQLQIPGEKIAAYTYQDILKNLTFAGINKIINAYQQQTGCGQKASVNMSLPEVLEVERSGLVTIGAHTINHPILKNEDDGSSQSQITNSIKKLEGLLQHPVKYFAYPNGRPGIDFGEREINCLRKNGISMGFSTELNRLSAGSNMLSLPRMGFARMGLSPSNPLIYFRLSLGKKWVDIKSIGKPSEKEIRKKIGLVLAH
jgi:peptidoglycan/xylan/chitin deacetylase (PgdA/CDA1 family)